MRVWANFLTKYQEFEGKNRLNFGEMNRVKKRSIDKHITFHCFRHTFATLQLTQGTDIYTVSKMLGHSDVKTTQIYAQIVDEKARQ